MITTYFDYETGGVEPHHPNISLAAVAMNDGKEIDSFYRLIQFDPSTAQEEALRINNYDPDRWAKEARPEELVTREFSAFLSKYKSLTLISSRTGRPYQVARLAGFNSATFDGPRLGDMFDRYKMFPPWRRPTLDIFQLVLNHCDENGIQLVNSKLATVAAHFGISTDGAHDALADCRMTAAVHGALRR